MEKRRTYCWTYFLVRINNPEKFKFKDFCERLELDFIEMSDWYIDDQIEIGFNTNYEVDVNDMLRETLKDLFGKEKILVELAEKYDLEYFLERVPTIVIDSDDPYPILSLDMDIVDFLHYTNTKDDLDFYAISNDGKKAND